MKSTVTLPMLAIAFLLPPSVAVAQLALPGRGGMRLVPMRSAASTANRPVVRPTVAKPVWKIPAGKYGLQLNDGTRIIGQPAKGWSAMLKTSFGTVTIPLAQITSLEPTGNGQFSAFLKNGDRVTGVLVSTVLSFETDFGTMTVPTPDLVRLSSATAVAKNSPASVRTSTKQPSKTTARTARAAQKEKGSESCSNETRCKN